MTFYNNLLNILFLFLGTASFLPLQAQETAAKDDYQFTIVTQSECTAVKSQDRTGTCWSFSTVSFLEAEMMRLGKEPIDLSEMFIVRHTYPKKAQKYIRYHGTTNFSEGSLGHDVIFALRDHGIVPESVYSGKPNNEKVHDHSTLVKDLKSVMDEAMESRPLDMKWKDQVNEILDKKLGAVPEQFEYKGKTFTPQSFAEQVVGLNPDDYVSLTSFSHHPFYEQFVLEIPDNFADGSFYNVPLEDLLFVADYALRQGYTVEWDGDVSDPGFSARQGLAIVPQKNWADISAEEKQTYFQKPHPQKEITQQIRQEAFENYTLTDDHLMHVVGMAMDQDDQEYYIIKNSWGSKGLGFEGYIYASKAYFAMNTVSILVHKEAIPRIVREKLGI